MRHINIYVLDKTGKVVCSNYTGNVHIATWAENQLKWYEANRCSYNITLPLRIYRAEERHQIGEIVKVVDA